MLCFFILHVLVIKNSRIGCLKQGRSGSGITTISFFTPKWSFQSRMCLSHVCPNPCMGPISQRYINEKAILLETWVS